MVPVRDAPGRRLDVTNLDALCNRCHNGFKRRIEKYARITGQVFLLPLWIKYPDTRPAHFKFRMVSPTIAGEFVVNAPAWSDEIAAMPMLFDVPDIRKEIFTGPGELSSIANCSDVPIKIMDGNEPVYPLEDGETAGQPFNSAKCICVLIVFKSVFANYGKLIKY